MDVGVVEVGMGGSLDATNVLDNQVISVISKISRDHENFLGSTLEEIARHKAGILRPGVPYIVNPINEWYVQEVIHTYAKQIGAGPCIIPDTPERRESLFKTQNWTKLATKLRPFQRDNAVLGYLAFTAALESLGHSSTKASKLLPSLRSKTVLPGRMQRISCPVGIFGTPQKILVDGAHNPDAASELSSFVQHDDYRNEDSPVTWILAMTKGKDAREYLRRILRPGDRVVTTSFGSVEGMPWVQPVDPAVLKEIVLQVEPSVTAVHVPEPGPLRALCTAKYLSLRPPRIVLTGSLYLVGEFIRDKELLKSDPDAFDMRDLDLQERSRVNHSIAGGAFTMNRPTSKSDSTLPQDDLPQDDPESQRLLNEINKLEREVEKLKVEEAQLRRSESFSSDSSGDNDLGQDMGTGSISRYVRGKGGPRIRYF